MKKIKEFFENISPQDKIKYISVTALVIVLAAAVGVVFAVNNSKTPRSAVSSESVSIEYDEEIVLDFDNDESDAVSESVSENTDPEEATDTESAGSTEDTDSTEETADAESTDETVGTTDTAETPSENTEKTDPLPETKPTETTKPETKPAQTTAAVTKPVQTTAPATKPAETTAPVTQKPVTEAPVTKPVETTKPSANEPEEEKNHGNWVIKQKKYAYSGCDYIACQSGKEYPIGVPNGDVIILNIENKSDKAYTITISGKYLDASGNVIKNETQTFEGFAANWSNYFVFAPGIKFDKFTFDFSAKKYNAETRVQYMTFFDEVSIGADGWAMTADGVREVLPTSAEEMESLKQMTSVAAGVKMRYKGEGVVDYWGKLVFFDKNGELVFIRSAGHGNITYDPSIKDEDCGGLGRPLYITDVPFDKASTYKLPDNLTSITGFFAIESFSYK